MSSWHSIRQIGLGLGLALGLFVSSVHFVNSSSELAPITQMSASKLLKEFKKAQKTELKELEKRQKAELKELKVAQSARQKEWELKEKESRHAFFKVNLKGPERRTYIQDFLDRRKVMVSVLKSERDSKVQDNEVKRRTLIEEQKAKRKEFEEALAKGERPDPSLWPR